MREDIPFPFNHNCTPPAQNSQTIYRSNQTAARFRAAEGFLLWKYYFLLYFTMYSVRTSSKPRPYITIGLSSMV